jgi:hypothetical protein
MQYSKPSALSAKAVSLSTVSWRNVGAKKMIVLITLERGIERKENSVQLERFFTGVLVILLFIGSRDYLRFRAVMRPCSSGSKKLARSMSTNSAAVS